MKNKRPSKPQGNNRDNQIAGHVCAPLPGQDDRISASALLRQSRLRLTQQRVALAELLFGQGMRHVTAETVLAEAREAGIKVSLATVYNTLNQLTAAGLLRQVTIDAGHSYFDTNAAPHQHFFLEQCGTLIDIRDDVLRIQGLPSVPEGTEVSRVDVVIRVKPRA